MPVLLCLLCLLCCGPALALVTPPPPMTNLIPIPAPTLLQDGSLRLYLCVMLHAQPLVCDAGGWAVCQPWQACQAWQLRLQPP